MGGNFPAGKREGRDGREGPLIFGTRGRPGGRTKVILFFLFFAGNPAGRQDTRSLLKIEIITKNRSLLKIETFISFSILARFGRF